MLTMDFRESAGARMSNVTWRIEPETILVSGPAEVLNNMDSIVLDEFDLASSGQHHQLQLRHPHPGGVREPQRRHPGDPADLLSTICSAAP